LSSEFSGDGAHLIQMLRRVRNVTFDQLPERKFAIFVVPSFELPDLIGNAFDQFSVTGSADPA
jgi:hypothetical protein